MGQNRYVIEGREKMSFTLNREVIVLPAILDVEELSGFGLVSFNP